MTSKPITWPFLIRDNLEKDKRAAKPVIRETVVNPHFLTRLAFSSESSKQHIKEPHHKIFYG